MSEFRFAEPGWAMLLWGVLAFTIFLGWLDSRANSTLSRFLSPLMQSRLAMVPSIGRRRAALALLGLSLAMGVVALMRPQWGVHLISTPRVGAEIMVCLDVSNSMLAEDVTPNRLERAKAEIRDLLPYLRGDSVGLIAFAGRASVLAPITPDFSFLRMVLDSAGPSSVSRGGTRLEEPIRKAVAGFGAGASVSRSILLITDGEDHDSFPLEAAKEAAERGIKILSIGFGDETGSPIQITDPKTGARHMLRDSSGQQVMSRLDGDTLRQIALTTGGAYIPAGTGVLDLASIYDRYIANLTRGTLDGESRTIRGEAYQWAVLAALLFLTASVVVAAGNAVRRRRSATPAVMAAIVLPLLLFAATSVRAQPAADAQGAAANGALSAGTGATPPTDEQASDESADVEVIGGQTEEPEPQPPREVYNAGLVLLGSNDLDGAEKLLEEARSRAAFDGLLRRDATYDLGILDTRRADAKIEAEPEEALRALERAASWFRETISLDAKDADARHNLELVLRRALVLADAIAKKNEKALIDDITALMEEQRTFLTGLRAAVQTDVPAAGANTAPTGAPVAGPTTGANSTAAGASAVADPERNRDAFRDLATKQLALSSAAADVSERAVREQALIRAKPAEQQTPEESMKAVQIDGVLEALHQAREQMGQARGRLRRLEGTGAYRAASTTLTNLKRARDRLLDPVQVLDILIADALELSRLSGVKVSLDSGDPSIPPQKWLTTDHLGDTCGELRERVEELNYNFVTVVTQSDAAAQTGQLPEGQNASLLERVREAEPMVAEAAAELATARTALDQGQVRESLPSQYAAITKLAAARESFLDLQRLIELLYADEKRIESIVSPQEEMPAADKAEYAATASELQQTNTARGANVERALKEEIAATEAAAAAKAAEAEQQAQPGAAPAAPQQGPDPEAEKQRLELAETYLTAARGALGDAATKLDELATRAGNSQHETPDPAVGDASTPHNAGALPLEAWQPSQAAVAEAVARIEDLRRLFFSIIDHLKELAQRQLELGDQTEETAAMASADPSVDYTDKAGPLGARQETLSTTAAPLADALREQSQQPIPPEAQGQVPEDFPQRLAEAATHVDTARTWMDSAKQGLSINPPAFADTRSAQNTALQELAAAIQLLSPPEEQEQQQQDQEQQQEDQQGEDEQQEDQQGGQPQPGGGNEQKEDQEKTDPAQLLQGIRDREAERRADRDKASQSGYEPVEKDW